MLLQGSYYNRNNEEVTVYILTGDSQTETVEIGANDGDYFFTSDAVETESQVNGTFDHLLLQQAKVRLLCRNYTSDFFCSSCRDAVVNIYRQDVCVFAGFIEPQAYSQPYNEELDEVELSCVDCLSALKYSNYKDIGALGIGYDTVKAKASQRTFLSLVKEILQGVTAKVDILSGSPFALYYDQSKLLEKGGGATDVFDGISVSELLFLGDEEDDVWTQEDVLTEIMRYLDLHIVQDGLRFFAFSWSTIRNGGKTAWVNLVGDGSLQTAVRTKTIKNEIVSDCDCKFSIADTYNQLILTDDVTEMENIVENPLDSDSLTPAFGNYQKYMTEYIAEGEGKTAIGAFGAMVTGGSTDWSDASQVDWYVWVKKNPMWKFSITDLQGTRSEDIYGAFAASGEEQQDIPYRLGGGVGAALMAFGSMEKKNGGSDNSPASAPSMSDYLVIGLPTSRNATYPTGNWWVDNVVGGTHTVKSTYLTDNDGQKLKEAAPIAEYVGNTAGGNFSPSDEETTHYIEITGKIALNPIMNETECFGVARTHTDWSKGGKYWHKTVASRNNGDGRYYTQRFYRAKSWKDEVEDLDAANASKLSRGVYPFTGTGAQGCEFNYNAANEARDTVSKVGVLQCMLVIGDKCVVETLPDNGGSGNGEPGDFAWRKFKERSECADDDEYYAQSFAIGFDPKLKDKIIGTEFDIQKNAPYTVGVTVEGTLIPIKKSDKVSGQVRFYILGPVNEEWLNVTKRHKTWFRKTKYYTDSVYLLEQTASIMLKDFEVKVVSDNGKVGAVSDNKDIVYMSDTKESFVNKKDDLEFKFTTALTSAECSRMGVNNSVKLSSPRNERSEEALLSIYSVDAGEAAKPEQLYVDAYWREWHEPRVVMTQNLIDTVTHDGTAGTDLSFLDLFRNNAIGKTFYVQGISRNLTECTAEVVMREVFE